MGELTAAVPVRTAVENGVGILSFEDAASRNALDERTVPLLESALEELGRDIAVKVIVLEGLPDVFCSGGSRDMLRGLARGTHAPVDLLLPKRVLDVPVPVIAAMAGHAVGGGFALGLCADIVLIGRDSRYGLSFMNFGFTPGMGTTRMLEHVLSPALAHELLYTGRNVRGAEFEGRSGFNAILPRQEVSPRAREIAGRIADKPRTALEVLKRTLSLPKRQCFEATYTVETLMHQVTLQGADVERLIEEEF
jgi:polyketide biosynthesis enoyl-CoA hydratase PksI